jgi:hypothetical protein
MRCVLLLQELEQRLVDGCYMYIVNANCTFDSVYLAQYIELVTTRHACNQQQATLTEHLLHLLHVIVHCDTGLLRMQSDVPVPHEQPAVMISMSAGAVIQKAIDSHRGRQLNGRLVVSKACLTDEKRWHKLHQLEHAHTAVTEVIDAAAAVEVAVASSGSSGSSGTTARRLQHTHDQQQQPVTSLQNDSSSSTVDSIAAGTTASAVHDSGDSTVTDDDVTVDSVTVQLQQREVLSGTLQVSAATAATGSSAVTLSATDRIEFIR